MLIYMNHLTFTPNYQAVMIMWMIKYTLDQLFCKLLELQY